MAGPALSLSAGGVVIIILMQALLPLAAGTVALMAR